MWAVVQVYQCFVATWDLFGLAGLVHNPVDLARNLSIFKFILNRFLNLISMYANE
jgi:hypothetical protein